MPPVSGRLLDRRVAFRAFGVLGPVEALLSMFAFLVTWWASGWRPGDDVPSAAVLAAASGATFATVVLAQKANAFACRSSTLPAWRMSPTANRYLLVAIVAELLFAGGILFVDPMADFFDQAAPVPAGWMVALASIPLVLLADAAVKRWAAASRRHAGSA